MCIPRPPGHSQSYFPGKPINFPAISSSPTGIRSAPPASWPRPPRHNPITGRFSAGRQSSSLLPLHRTSSSPRCRPQRRHRASFHAPKTPLRARSVPLRRGRRAAAGFVSLFVRKLADVWWERGHGDGSRQLPGPGGGGMISDAPWKELWGWRSLRCDNRRVGK